MLDDPARLVRDILSAARYTAAGSARAAWRTGKIRAGSRNAARGRSLLREILCFLRTYHDGVRRIERLFLLFAAGEIALDRRGCTKAVWADQRFQSGTDFVDQVALDLLPHFQAFTGDLCAIRITGPFGPAEQIAAHIDNRNIARA